MEFWIAEEEELMAVAQVILAKAKHRIFLLQGDLGAGKTALVKAFLRQMYSQDTAMSPTYTLVNEYETDQGRVFHFDLYRLERVEEALDFGIEEYLDSNAFCFIEWPELILPLLDENYHCITIEQKDKQRKISWV